VKLIDVRRIFYGWRVVAAVFVLAMFGWGVGFYGPPIYLQTVQAVRGWSLAVVSTAVTVHYLFGAMVVANLPKLYTRFGVPIVTKAGSIALAIGVIGWAIANAPWQLFVATALSGGGWVTMSAAAVNAIIAPWFVRARPAALSAAYNGSSVGGVVFSPLWVASIGLLGFPWAAAVIGLAMIATIWMLANVYFAKTPEQLGVAADGGSCDETGSFAAPLASPPLSSNRLWSDFRFLTLSSGMALGLFAQIGLLAHLFSLLVPALGQSLAGFAVSLATGSAIVGRTMVGWLMPPSANRRLFACASYLIQIAGSLAFLVAAGNNVPLLFIGTVLFGAGIGNATSLPPLIAQMEFANEVVPRVVALIVAISQATYAFAPAAFGLIRQFAPHIGFEAPGACPEVFVAAALIQALAIVAFLIGSTRLPILHTG
jgi:hypothetical protein